MHLSMTAPFFYSIRQGRAIRLCIKFHVAVKKEDFNTSKILILYPPPNPSIWNLIHSD